VDFSPASTGRMIVALAVLGGLAISAWFTIEPGKYRSLCLILLAFFAGRVLLGHTHSRKTP
jgi:hypothetical protein